MAMLLAHSGLAVTRFGAPAARRGLRTQNGSVTCMAASRPLWLPGERDRLTVRALRTVGGFGLRRLSHTALTQAAVITSSPEAST